MRVGIQHWESRYPSLGSGRQVAAFYFEQFHTMHDLTSLTTYAFN